MALYVVRLQNALTDAQAEARRHEPEKIAVQKALEQVITMKTITDAQAIAQSALEQRDAKPQAKDA